MVQIWWLVQAKSLSLHIDYNDISKNSRFLTFQKFGDDTFRFLRPPWTKLGPKKPNFFPIFGVKEQPHSTPLG